MTLLLSVSSTYLPFAFVMIESHRKKPPAFVAGGYGFNE